MFMSVNNCAIPQQTPRTPTKHAGSHHESHGYVVLYLCDIARSWFFYSWGTCYLASEADPDTRNDGNAIYGLPDCTHKMPENASHVADDNVDTCYTMPAKERNRVIIIDLGSLYNIEDVLINTGRRDSVFTVYAGETLQEVYAENISETTWQTPDKMNSMCNGLRSLSTRYGENGESYTNSVNYEETLEVARIPCNHRGRYIGIRAKDFNRDLTICEVQVLHFPESTFEHIHTELLKPTLEYRFDMHDPKRTDERGLG